MISRRIATTIIALLVLIAAGSKLRSQVSVPERASATGIVIDQIGGKPISGADLIFQILPEPRVLTGPVTKTDADGKFAMGGLAAGRYAVVVSHSGYLEKRNKFLLELKAGEHAQDLRAMLVPSVSVSGRIVDSSGNPKKGVRIRAVEPPRNVNGVRNFAPCLESKAPDVLSDVRGAYELTVAPGDYYLVACETVFQFYPGAIDIADARSVRIPEAETFSVSDFKFAATLTYSVRFRIPVSVGFDFNREQLEITRKSLNGIESVQLIYGERSQHVMKNIGGDSYLAPALAPGTYRIHDELVNSTSVLYGDADIQITDRDLDAETLNMRPGVALTGRVGFVSGIQLADPVNLLIRVMGADGIPFGANSFSAAAPDGGMYPFSGSQANSWRVGGGYKVEAIRGLLGDSYVSTIRYAGKTISGNTITMSADPAATVEVTIDSRGGAVEGDVRDARGLLAGGSSVALIPSADHRNDSARFKNAVADMRGHFSIHGVPPGEYSIIAWDKAGPFAWEDSDFQKTALPSATRVTVSAGVAATRNVAVIPE